MSVMRRFHPSWVDPMPPSPDADLENLIRSQKATYESHNEKYLENMKLAEDHLKEASKAMREKDFVKYKLHMNKSEGYKVYKEKYAKEVKASERELRNRINAREKAKEQEKKMQWPMQKEQEFETAQLEGVDKQNEINIAFLSALKMR